MSSTTKRTISPADKKKMDALEGRRRKLLESVQELQAEEFLFKKELKGRYKLKENEVIRTDGTIEKLNPEMVRQIQATMMGEKRPDQPAQPARGRK